MSDEIQPGGPIENLPQPYVSGRTEFIPPPSPEQKFREEELVRTQRYDKSLGRNVDVIIVKVAGRLRLLHEDHADMADERKNIRFQSEILAFQPGKEAQVKVTVDTRRGRFIGHGTSNAARDAKLATSLLEVAETRAIARALRFAGYGVEMVGLEELEGTTGAISAPDPEAHPSLDSPVREGQLETIEELVKKLADLTQLEVKVPRPETIREGSELIVNLREEVQRLEKDPGVKERAAALNAEMEAGNESNAG